MKIKKKKLWEKFHYIGMWIGIQKTKIMAFSPIPSLQIDGGEIETVNRLYLGSKITVDGDCSHEFKRHFLLGRKAMTNLESILKIRDIILPNKDTYTQSYGFSSSHVQM